MNSETDEVDRPMEYQSVGDDSQLRLKATVYDGDSEFVRNDELVVAVPEDGTVVLRGTERELEVTDVE